MWIKGEVLPTETDVIKHFMNPLFNCFAAERSMNDKGFRKYPFDLPVRIEGDPWILIDILDIFPDFLGLFFCKMSDLSTFKAHRSFRGSINPEDCLPESRLAATTFSNQAEGFSPDHLQ